MKFQKERTNKNNIEEAIVKGILFIMALTSIISLGLITFFVFKEGLPFMIGYGIKDFIMGTTWNPSNQVYGIFPMIVGSVIVTIFAIVVGAPIGICCCHLLSRNCTSKGY
ncbi:MAG: hypothetical protein LRY73_19105 [Bacillus sp. (in: Bacteria)]|nr:hypothetical protein [Bacillus sp. (in: firmicutes)]